MQNKKHDPTNRFKAALFAVLLCSAIFAPSASWAGPPFITDDPEPVGLHRGEFYIASQYANDKDGKSGTLPHFELNYGALPDTQLHLLVPLAFVHTNGGPTEYGIGDTEVGVKYRFIHETDTTPQVGIFPILRVPTGDSDRGLGGGQVPLFLPVWLQKSLGPWTTYGGGRLLDQSGRGEQELLAAWLAGAARNHQGPDSRRRSLLLWQGHG